jgi:hypothetical protein
LKVLSLHHLPKPFGNNDVNHGIALFRAMLLLSLMSMLLMNSWSQAFGLTLMFVCLFIRLRSWFWPLLVFLHWLPLLISAEGLDAAELDSSVLYFLAQLTPIYAILRVFEDPWVGEWIYGDSPFHFSAEPWTSYELWYVHLPLAFLLMIFRGRKRV